MAFIKSEMTVANLIKGDVFRVVESVGNLRQTIEYEVMGSPKMEDKVMHVGDSGTTRTMEWASVKVMNRRNGAKKTKQYSSNTLLTVWRPQV